MGMSVVLSVFSSPVCAGNHKAFHGAPSNKQVGVGGWYGQYHHGKKTASGEYFDSKKLTAAHPSLPFNSWVKVTNLRSGRTVVLRVTDRGPYVKGRIIDVSQQAASILGIKNRGVAKVAVESIGAPPTNMMVAAAANKVSTNKTASDIISTHSSPESTGFIPKYVMMANAR